MQVIKLKVMQVIMTEIDDHVTNMMNLEGLTWLLEGLEFCHGLGSCISHFDLIL